MQYKSPGAPNHRERQLAGSEAARSGACVAFVPSIRDFVVVPGIPFPKSLQLGDSSAGRLAEPIHDACDQHLNQRNAGNHGIAW